MGWREDEAREVTKNLADIEDRRAALAPLSDAERRWIARFKRCIKDMPPRLCMLAGSQLNGVTIYADGDIDGHEVGHVLGRIGSLS